MIFRDPRDVVLSAYKMRSQVLLSSYVAQSSISEADYIRDGFEVSEQKSWHEDTNTRTSSMDAGGSLAGCMIHSVGRELIKSTPRRLSRKNLL